MKKWAKLLVMLGALAGSQVWAQAPDSAPTPAAQTQNPDDIPLPTQNGPTPQYTNVDQQQSLNFLGEAAETSTLRLGAAAGYLFQSTNSQSNLNSFLIGPRIGIISLHPRLSLNFSYTGNLTLHTTGVSQNYFSQNAGIDILYQISPHWQAHAADHYVYTADPFESYFATGGPPLPNEPNPSVYIPTLRSEENIATLDLSDRLTRTDTLTFNGNQFFRRYENYTGFTLPFFNVISYGGGATYMHQFSPRWSLGGSYSFTSLDFAKGQQRSGINAIRAILTYLISPTMSITITAGPEYVSARDAFEFFGFFFVVHQSSWEPAVGVNFAWRTGKNALSAAYNRQTSDGGGLLATTNSSVVKAAYMRQLSSRWTGTVSTIFADNVSFTTGQAQQGPNRSYKFWNTQVEGIRKFSPAWHLTLRYAFVHTDYNNIGTLGSRGYNNNALQATINYIWNHPLGR